MVCVFLLGFFLKKDFLSSPSLTDSYNWQDQSICEFPINSLFIKVRASLGRGQLTFLKCSEVSFMTPQRCFSTAPAANLAAWQSAFYWPPLKTAGTSKWACRGPLVPLACLWQDSGSAPFLRSGYLLRKTSGKDWNWVQLKILVEMGAGG